MSIKHKLSIFTLMTILGAMLIGGGAMAYFSNEQVINNTFSSGTVKLSVTPPSVGSSSILLDSLSPGEPATKFIYTVENDGTLKLDYRVIPTNWVISNGTDLYTIFDDNGNFTAPSGFTNFQDNLIISITTDSSYTLFNSSMNNLDTWKTLDVNENEDITISLQLSASAPPNEYQGLSLKGGFKFEAYHRGYDNQSRVYR